MIGLARVVDLHDALLDPMRRALRADHLGELVPVARRPRRAVDADQSAAFLDEPRQPLAHGGLGGSFADDVVEEDAVVLP